MMEYFSLLSFGLLFRLLNARGPGDVCGDP